MVGSKSRFSFRKKRSDSIASTASSKKEKHPYRGIQRIPEGVEDEFLYFYRQYRPNEQAYPADWQSQHHFHLLQQQLEQQQQIQRLHQQHNNYHHRLRHSFSCPQPPLSSMSSPSPYSNPVDEDDVVGFRQQRAASQQSMMYGGGGGGRSQPTSPESEYEFGSCYSSFAPPLPPMNQAAAAPSPTQSSQSRPLRHHNKKQQHGLVNYGNASFLPGKPSSSHHSNSMHNSSSPFYEINQQQQQHHYQAAASDDLSGMLHDKMNLLSQMSPALASSYINGVGVRDDSQSRDSGHSSASGGTTSTGSPDWRARAGGGPPRLRRPRGGAGMMPPRSASASSSVYAQAWHDLDASDEASIAVTTATSSSDKQSLYSYNTAMMSLCEGDERDSGVSSNFSSNDNHPHLHNNQYYFNPHNQQQQQQIRDTSSVHSSADSFGESTQTSIGGDTSRLESWTPLSETRSLASNGGAAAAAALRRRRVFANNRSRSDEVKVKREPYAPAEFSHNDAKTLPDSRSTITSSSSASMSSVVASKKVPVIVVDKKAWIKQTALWCIAAFKTLLMVTSFVILVLAGYSFLKTASCRLSRDQTVDISQLKESLAENLFGQNLAVNAVIRSIDQFVEIGKRKDDNNNQNNAVVLMLTGWIGTGKSLTAKLIQDQFPVRANNHIFSVPLTFCGGSNQQKYWTSSAASAPSQMLKDLAEVIRKSCGLSLVVLEDIDDAPKEIMDSLENFILDLVDKPRESSTNNGTLIVTTSSTGGRSISKKMVEWTQEQLLSRDQITEQMVIDLLIEEKEGDPVLALNSTLTSRGIPVIIAPYLPLSREHLTQCIVKEFKEQGGGGATASKADVATILDELQYFSDAFPVFASAGCKRIAAKVGYLLASRETFLGIS